MAKGNRGGFKIETLTRRRKVADLRLSGMTGPEVQRHLDISTAQYCKDMKAIHKIWRQETAAAHGEVVAREIAKLDRLELKMNVELGNAGTPTDKAKIADRLLRISERRGKLLGLDQPDRVELTATVDVRARREKERLAILADPEASRLACDLEARMAGLLPDRN
jgi:hypothetical protein